MVQTKPMPCLSINPINSYSVKGDGGVVLPSRIIISAGSNTSFSENTGKLLSDHFMYL